MLEDRKDIFREFDISERLDFSDKISLKVKSRNKDMTITSSGEKTALAIGIFLLEKIKNHGGTIIDDQSLSDVKRKLVQCFSEKSLAKLLIETDEIVEWLNTNSGHSEPQRVQDSVFATPDFIFSFEDKIPLIEQAIDDQKDLVIEYWSIRRGCFTKRRISPSKITGEELSGFCHLRGETRNFKLTRIKNLKILNDD
jgi:hypothetical protein